MKLKKSNDHKGYYASISIILLLGLYLFYLLSFDRQSQMIVIVLTTFFYVGWGILHHVLHHDVTAKIVIEYVLIGMLGISIIFFLIH